MNTEAKDTRKLKRSVSKTKPANSREREHAEIVRMAAAQAQARATQRHDAIAAAAYLRAQQRGFEPGHELEDWLAAEAEISHAELVLSATTEAWS